MLLALCALWNYDPIPRPQQDVLFEVALDDGIVIDYVLGDLHPISTNHPNIIPIHSVGEDRGVHFFAMQLIRGQTMAEVIAQLVNLQTEGPQT